MSIKAAALKGYAAFSTWWLRYECAIAWFLVAVGLARSAVGGDFWDAFILACALLNAGASAHRARRNARVAKEVNAEPLAGVVMRIFDDIKVSIGTVGTCPRCGKVMSAVMVGQRMFIEGCVHVERKDGSGTEATVQ
jgi:hypothetical protein